MMMVFLVFECVIANDSSGVLICVLSRNDMCKSWVEGGKSENRRDLGKVNGPVTNRMKVCTFPCSGLSAEVRGLPNLVLYCLEEISRG